MIKTMFRDNVPTVLLSSWPLDCLMFNGDLAAGPVPTLFTEDEQASLDALSENVARAHADIQRMARAFIMTETVTPEEAAGIAKKPRQGAVIYPFKRTAFREQERATASKRPRIISDSEDSDEGKKYLEN